MSKKLVCLGQGINKVPMLGMGNTNICGDKPIVVLTCKENPSGDTFEVPVCLKCWNACVSNRFMIIKVTPVEGNI
jgi:hypothetical protein